jgi:dihydrolipoamide dehydrogenase
MAMGVTCAEAIAGKNPQPLDFQNMPRATYCHPQVASIGMTEELALQSDYTISVGKVNFQSNGKALGLNDYAGWVKIIVDQKTNNILGAHLVGPEVTELLPELSLAQAHQLSPTDIGHIVHAHPTLSEILHEAAKAVSGEAIHS